MGLFKWLCSVGTSGQTARTIAKQLASLKQAAPQASERQLLGLILDARHRSLPYRPGQLSGLEEILASETVRPVDFIVAVLFAEAGWGAREIDDQGTVMYDIAYEALRKYRLE